MYRFTNRSIDTKYVSFFICLFSLNYLNNNMYVKIQLLLIVLPVDATAALEANEADA